MYIKMSVDRAICLSLNVWIFCITFKSIDVFLLQSTTFLLIIIIQLFYISMRITRHPDDQWPGYEKEN